MAIVLVLLIAALVICALLTQKSRRAISKDVRILLIALVCPMVGNLIITLSSDWLTSNIGCYLYFIGLDWVVISLLRFTVDYCSIPYVGTRWRIVANAIILVDVIQLLLNPLIGHAFTTVPTLVEGSIYYSLVPFAGQAFHRIVAYGIFFVSLFIFAYKTVKAAKIYVERYLVILICMIIAGVWETFYIFSGTPIDQSMISFGVFGLLVYYFSLIYRPMRLLDRMLARAVSGLKSAVFFFDSNGECIYGNDQAREMVDFGRDIDIPENLSKKISKAIGGWSGKYNHDWHKVERIVEGDEEHFLDVTVQQVFDEKGRHLGASVSVRDITEDERALKREQYLASHDLLTGLYNQRFFYERVREEIDANPQHIFEIVALDIKDFKIINDIFDKDFGDQVLRETASAMREDAVPGEVYGRLSGDKFGMLVPADAFSEERMEDVLRSFSVAERANNYPITIHMGVYEVSERDLPVSIMFDRAFMAIKSIKNDYNHHIARYDEGMRDELIWNQSISSQLERAISERQLCPYLQPMVDEAGIIEGAEVLVRWLHPEEGLLSPARFIPVFESNGMIAQLDMYMWECACEILRDWADRGIDMFLSVNISPKDFFFIDVYGTISMLVKKYNIDPAKLRLEITETIMMTDLENRLSIIEKLRSDGFLIEMDDFGSGYSSLNMLKDIPVDVLKIDMMFLYKTRDQTKAQTILKTIIDLSSQLGIPSLTEGVETESQVTMLVNMGCRLFQGYYFAKPMPVAEFEERYQAA